MKKTLSKKDKKEINERIRQYNYQIDKKQKADILDDRILVEDEALLFRKDSDIYPTLRLILKQDTKLKKITVDMGAIRFIADGADIMRPGIVHIEPGIQKGDPVVIVDIEHEKPFALGISLHSSEDMQKTQSGKAIKNIHYVGDDIWNTSH